MPISSLDFSSFSSGISSGISSFILWHQISLALRLSHSASQFTHSLTYVLPLPPPLGSSIR
ncbi:hypothetical protein Csa_021836 [Cucumis sativus]|uniref:Uncharacterized protein n=1 Tax=Cucumis sativus TaxID=3659 RepID=A0A0A0LQJ3_CUCSA|nr:hypothetical protein Csa_021836 [Cucumis sativus]